MALKLFDFSLYYKQLNRDKSTTIPNPTSIEEQILEDVSGDKSPAKIFK